ncbi:hypothetical protein [Methylobacterium sp. Leaf118]|uniref:hypothetical protein n=1 Tax=Methylobacterium sp. Leaf118 TaxID=2876562 RepID=UPI001E64C6B6|nr:hypothetical protein [Methylobacterium sp. Leaf118]
MTAPTTKNYFDVASWMYGNADNDRLPSIPFGLERFDYAPGQFDSGLSPTGFHGAAFVTQGDDPTVIIGFEGTDAAGIAVRKAFLLAQIAADTALYFGYLPIVLVQSLDFARAVLAAAEEQGIPKERVVVTGHSLGAGAAAYVSTQLGLDGVTWAAPGLDDAYLRPDSGGTLKNYVVFGDPVGNYSATPDNYENGFLDSTEIRRVGDPDYIGDPAGRTRLETATALFDPGPGYDPEAGLLEVGLLAAVYHRLTYYGDQFDPSLNAGAPVAVDDSRILSGPDYVRYFGDLVDRSALVSDAFYNVYNDDVRAAGIDPEAHYSLFGWREGRDPNAFFSTTGYRAANPDVAGSGSDPLAQYHATGWREGRDPSAAFDTQLYLLRNPDVAAAGIDPLAHYLDYGQYEGRRVDAAIGQAGDLIARAGFDAEYYLLANPDIAAFTLALGLGEAFAEQHYRTSGWREGRNPNAFFDTSDYLAANPDVKAAGIDPLAHYDQFGWREGRDPSGTFDTTAYLTQYTDVAAAHINPLLHYMTFGVYEGRSLSSDSLIG